jgi:hypothetical protein
MRQHDLFIAALCADWLEAGTATRTTPRADRVMEISRQINSSSREARAAEKAAGDIRGD